MERHSSSSILLWECLRAPESRPIIPWFHSSYSQSGSFSYTFKLGKKKKKSSRSLQQLQHRHKQQPPIKNRITSHLDAAAPVLPSVMSCIVLEPHCSCFWTGTLQRDKHRTHTHCWCDRYTRRMDTYTLTRKTLH